MSVRRLLAGAASLVALAGPAPAQELQLERVVLLSRHGVRSPTKPLDELDRHVATPWARWPVGPGELTPRGARLMTLMGGFYRSLYARRGLLPADGCPADGAVAAWADVGQRTRLTAQSILDGLYPGCGLKELHQADLAAPDPLFHPPKLGGACPLDPAPASAAIVERMGEFPGLLAAYAAPLVATQAILCPPALTPGKACGLGAARPAIEPQASGGVAMKGPIAIASTAVEIFQLEAAQGMPRGEVAWGRLKDDAELRALMSVHVLEFDLMGRTRYIARRQGSRLLAIIAATLQDQRAFPGAVRGPQALRLALLAGHDTNIANIAGLLEIGWAIPGFQPNDPTPGGALAFELLREAASGRRYVRIAYYAQTLDQMRGEEPLDLDHPAGRATVELPGCKPEAQADACPLPRFLAITQAAIDPACAR